MTGEMWVAAIGFGLQLLGLAYGVGVFRTKVATMGEQFLELREDVKSLRSLVTLMLLGPEVDSNLLGNDTEVLKMMVMNTRRNRGVQNTSTGD